MAETPLQTDADGIPILDDIVDPEAPEEWQTVTAELDILDHAVLDQLSDDPAISQLLDDITADLQGLVTWKIEEFVKQEIQQVIHEAAHRAAPQLAESIRAQLRQALPALLAEAFSRRGG